MTWHHTTTYLSNQDATLSTETLRLHSWIPTKLIVSHTTQLLLFIAENLRCHSKYSNINFSGFWLNTLTKCLTIESN